MDNIFDVIINYSLKGQLIDKKIIEYIINYLRQENGLTDYISSIKYSFLNPQKAIPMQYNIAECYINVYRSAINFLKRDLSKNLTCNEYERTLIINCYILHIILHELCHASSLKQSFSNENDFETLYLKLTYYLIYKSYHQISTSSIFVKSEELPHQALKCLDSLKTKYQETELTERLADIRSFNDILTMLCKLDQNVIEAVSFYATRLTVRYLSGYNKTNPFIAPTTSYLNEYQALDIPGTKANVAQTIEAAKSLTANGTLEEKLQYGLPISPEEYQTVQNFDFIRARLPKRYR